MEFAALVKITVARSLEPHVLVGRLLGIDGRKTYTQATMYDADERVVARSGHIWIEIDPANFG